VRVTVSYRLESEVWAARRLTVPTDHGDFVLDNLTNDLAKKEDTPYV